MRLIAGVVAALSVAASPLTLPAPAAAHDAVVTQVSLSPSKTSATTPTSATLTVTASRCITVRTLGVAVRDRNGENADFPEPAHDVRICPRGLTITTGQRTFGAGAYIMFGFYESAGRFHNLSTRGLTVTPTTAQRPPAAGRRLAFSEDFNRIAWKSRWNGDRSSAYEFGDHNPKDNKLDWLTPAAVSARNGVATFTARPARRLLENGRRAWSTGLLTTEDTAEEFTARPGDYAETRVRLPQAQGAWPALWTWRDGNGEVDAFEYHPDNPHLLELTNRVLPAGTYHEDPATVNPGGWVTIGVMFGARSTDWYVNGRRVHSDGTGVGEDWSAHLILNLSVCAGEYHPAPQGTAPLTFSVDYLRVWR
ncbi:hypothetical protein [Streptomyces sp. NPDC091027]|uniref:glycoside hydrolase family 16 protein n=1 Tax=Streptomyces sp. NPDC091027 TaxID=3365971 RepID=UPI0037F354BC